eukprot:9445727-Pyramimonas_sp.AAC.1
MKAHTWPWLGRRCLEGPSDRSSPASWSARAGSIFSNCHVLGGGAVFIPKSYTRVSTIVIGIHARRPCP